MDELVRWLGEQLDVDKARAEAATWCEEAGVWHAEPSPFGARDGGQRWYVEDAMDDGVVSHVDPKASDDEGVARHIAEWDPARVLREIDAKRQRIAIHAGPHECASYDSVSKEINSCQWVDTDEACTTLRLETIPYVDRPGYLAEWAPTT